MCSPNLKLWSLLGKAKETLVHSTENDRLEETNNIKWMSFKLNHEVIFKFIVSRTNFMILDEWDYKTIH